MKPFLTTMATLCLAITLTSCAKQSPTNPSPSDFVRISGDDLVQPDGTRLFIRGTNLGNWLNPEGYMFGFAKTNSPRQINDMLCQLVGPDKTASFWKAFKDNYITRADIDFIAAQGANTVRLPFHYKLFTNEDYMGLTHAQDGFARIDSLISWCKAAKLYVILDMHDAPGGQTGDNIDDSYGYPWLLTSPASQDLFCSIWRDIAHHYRNETTILGYDLLNEPIAPYFNDVDSLNALLEPLYKKAVANIRQVDNNHIIMLGGAQWNGNFKVFTDWKFDDKLMFTCHRYGGDPTPDAIKEIVAFRDSTGLPMYMGEIGHNTYEWHNAFCRTLEAANIGYTFWPYKKMGDSAMMAASRPDGWDAIVAFSEASRMTFSEIRTARPNQLLATSALNTFLSNIKIENCTPQQDYINSLRFRKLPGQCKNVVQNVSHHSLTHGRNAGM